jgi:transposase
MLNDRCYFRIFLFNYSHTRMLNNDCVECGDGFKKATLRGVVLDNVEPGSIVSTDELMSYGLLTGDGYKHGMVKHGSKEWSYYDYRHDAVHNTNRVESFWRLFKKSVASTDIHISSKYADPYLDEFAFRSNHRVMGNAMFDLLIAAI